MLYKLEVQKNKVVVVDMVEEAQDDEFVYATEEEVSLLNPKIVENYANGITDTVIEFN